MLFVLIFGYFPVLVLVTIVGKLLDNPIGNAEAATLAQRLTQGFRGKLAQRSPRARARVVLLAGAGQRIAVGHRL